MCALPRLLHLFRALPPASTAPLATAADSATLAAFEKILTAKLVTPPQQTQAALPTRLGGCGLLRFKELRAQAWLGSWLGTLPAVRALGGAELASCAVLTRGSGTWAVALREAAAELAAEGVFLDQAGGWFGNSRRSPGVGRTGAQLWLGGNGFCLGSALRLPARASSPPLHRLPGRACVRVEGLGRGHGSWWRPRRLPPP